jgi:hypothetical protein
MEEVLFASRTDIERTLQTFTLTVRIATKIGPLWSSREGRQVCKTKIQHPRCAFRADSAMLTLGDRTVLQSLELSD